MKVQFDPKWMQRWQRILQNNSERELNMLLEWGSTPGLAILTQTAQVTATQEIRKLILQIMFIGYTIMDEHRHIFCIQELLQILQQTIPNLKLTNVYFHVNKLIKSGHLQEVIFLSDGRYDIAFFGLTAKFFMYEPLIEFINEESPFYKLISNLTSNDRGRDIIDMYNASLMNKSQLLISWFVENESLLLELDVDISTLYEFLMRLGIDSHEAELHQLIFGLFKVPYDHH